MTAIAIVDGRFNNDATFADATAGSWFNGKCKAKIASALSVSNSPAGDKFSTLHSFRTRATPHGMIRVGLCEIPSQPNGVNCLGVFAGATTQAGQESPHVAPIDADKWTGEILGRRVANAAQRWKGQL